jgi:hypothetical protein
VTDHTLREDIRNDLRDLFTGERTIGDSFPAPLVFVAVNAVAGLGWAAAAALVVGLAVALWRIRKGQQVVYAMGGIVAIGFTAFLALRSGRAESYFLPGILSAAGAAIGTIISIAVRRPLASWTSRFMRSWPLEWYWRDDVRPAYAGVSWIWAAFFAGRAAVQWVLFLNEEPELLAIAKVLTSWPTIIPLLIVSYVYGNRKLHRLGGPNVDEFLAGAEPPYEGMQRGF